MEYSAAPEWGADWQCRTCSWRHHMAVTKPRVMSPFQLCWFMEMQCSGSLASRIKSPNLS